MKKICQWMNFMITDKNAILFRRTLKITLHLKFIFYSLNYETSYKNSLTRLYCYTHIVFREKRLALYIYMNNEVIQKVCYLIPHNALIYISSTPKETATNMWAFLLMLRIYIFRLLIYSFNSHMAEKILLTSANNINLASCKIKY